MKQFCCALLMMASMALVLAGCSESSNVPVLPDDQALVPSQAPALSKVAAVVGSAVGGGHIETADPSTDFSAVKIGFTALKYADGSYGGQVELDMVNLDKSVVKKIHGPVKGVKFYGNVAMFWAELRTEFAVDFFGKASWREIFVVTDNGEGKSAAPDRMSNPWLTSEEVWPGEFETFWAMDAAAFLASIPGSLGTPPDYPLATGNIQVRVKQ
jgi:hypothetical protein